MKIENNTCIFERIFLTAQTNKSILLLLAFSCTWLAYLTSNNSCCELFPENLFHPIFAFVHETLCPITTLSRRWGKTIHFAPAISKSSVPPKSCSIKWKMAIRPQKGLGLLQRKAAPSLPFHPRKSKIWTSNFELQKKVLLNSLLPPTSYPDDTLWSLAGGPHFITSPHLIFAQFKSWYQL